MQLVEEAISEAHTRVDWCDAGLTTNGKQTRDRDTADCRDQGLDGANYAAHTSKMVGRLELEAEANAGMGRETGIGSRSERWYGLLAAIMSTSCSHFGCTV